MNARLALVLCVPVLGLAGCPGKSVETPGDDEEELDAGGPDVSVLWTFQLDVSKDGTGLGTVASAPEGISCGDTCSYYFEEASVTLTATAEAGSVFAGWGGACSGTEETCDVQLTEGEETLVTATFNYASATTSGGLAVITTGDDTFAFIPTDSGVFVIALEGDTASEILPLTFVANSCSADGTDLMVVCVSYSSSMIAIIDLTPWLAGGDPVVTEQDLGNKVYASFSGGGCLNCGVLADSGDHRFIVSSGDGYRILDYEGTLLGDYLSTDDIDLVTENFGFDPDENIIVSPEYETTANRLWLIDLDTDQIYLWTKTMVGTSSSAETGLADLDAAGVYSMTADAAAIDPSTGMLLIGHEWTPLLLALNLNAATYTDAEEGALYGSFEAPYSVTALANVYNVYNWLTTGMAIEPQNHLMFLEEEFTDAMGLVVLPTEPSTEALAIDEYISAAIPTPSVDICPYLSYGWTNVGDPHGLALFTAIVDGSPMGLLISSDKTCLGLVDLNALRAAPEEPDTNYVIATYNLVDEGVIEFMALQ